MTFCVYCFTLFLCTVVPTYHGIDVFVYIHSYLSDDTYDYVIIKPCAFFFL